MVAAVLAVASTGCATGPVAPCSELGSSVCGGRASLVAKDIAGWHNAQNPSCPFVRSLRAQILKRSDGGIVEHWKIEACQGKQFTYRAYLLSNVGSLTVMVSDPKPEDRVGPPKQFVKRTPLRGAT